MRPPAARLIPGHGRRLHDGGSDRRPEGLGSAAALLCAGVLSACSGSGAGGTGTLPSDGRETSMRGGPMHARMPTFQTYNACLAWMAEHGSDRALNRGPWQGGEVTQAGADPCLYYLARP